VVSTVLVCVASALAGAAPPPPAPAATTGERPAVAVMRLAVEPGLPHDLGKNVDEALLRALAAYRTIKVIGYSDVVAMLQEEARKQLLGCDTESCLAEIVGALGAALLVDGNIGRLGSEWVVNLKLLDASQATVLARASTSSKPDGAALVAGIPGAVTALLKVAATSGADRGRRLGVAVGWQPVGRARRLAPWIATGLTGALAVTGVVFGALAQQKANAAHDLYQGTAAWSDARDAANQRGRVADYFFIGAGVAAVGSAVLFFWNRDADRGVLVTPVVTTGSVGLAGRF